MTLASDIIADAYRETNLIPMGVAPTADQTTEALTRLNAILLSALGTEIGDPLCDVNISSGQYDQTQWCSPYIPDDTRLVFKLTASQSFALDPYPYEGQRLSFVDVGGNLATYNVTLDGNGRNIEGAATLTLSTNGDARHWLYRADTGNWVKMIALISSDTMPLPQEFDDFFVTTLAMRLNPRYGQMLTQETVQALKRSRSLIRNRYHNYKQVAPDLDTRNFQSNPYGFPGVGNSNDFDLGRPFPWR